MSITNVISPTESLIDAVVAALEIQPSMHDLSDQMIVFPGKRPAHFVRKKIGSVVGSSFIPPRVFSIEEFIEFLFRQKLGKTEQVLNTLDAIALLFELHQSMDEKIGGGHFVSLDRFMSLGWTLFGELEELVLADVSMAKLQSLAPGLQYGSIQMLGDYYQRFYETLHQRGLVTRALLYKEVAEQIEHIDLSEYHHLVLAGFFAPTHVEQKIFASLRAQNNIVFIFQSAEGIQSPNNLLWQNISTAEQKSQRPHPEIHFYQASDTHGQVYALSALLQQHVTAGAHPDERSAVILPDANALFPVVHETLPLLSEDEYNIALGYPVVRTPVYGFLQTLVELFVHLENNTMPISAYLKLMLHPYTKNIRAGTETELTRVLVHTMNELFARDRTALFLTLEEIENHPKLFDRVIKRLAESEHPATKEEIAAHLVEIHANTIRQMTGVRSIGEFAQRCIAVLTYMFEHSTASMHPLFRQYTEKIISLLQEVPSSRLGSKAFMEPSGYLSFLKNYLGSADVPFSGTPLQGLQVLGLLETRNLQFDSVYVLDVNEGVLPPGRGTDMLLPQSLRTILKMETYRDREALSEYYFSLLVQGAKHVHLFFTETPNGDRERSRFIQKLLWQEEQIADKLLDERVSSVRYRVQLANKTPKHIAKTDAMMSVLGSLEYSATLLDTYLQCPLRFYYHYVLGLREQDAVSDEMGQLDVGTVVHEILQELFMPLVNQRLSETNLNALNVEDVVRREFQKQFGTKLRGAQQLMLIQIQRQIKQFLIRYQIPMSLAQTTIVTGLEQDLRAFSNGVALRAKCDRIEQRGKTIHILDYKISGDDSRYRVNWKKLDVDERVSWNNAIGSLQLPFYVRIYSLITNTPAENIIPAYLLLGKNTIDESIETSLVPNDEDRGSCYRTTEIVIDGLINEIQNPATGFDPPQTLSDACPQCPFTALCGTAWVQGWTGS
jgi:hypothetical protein